MILEWKNNWWSICKNFHNFPDDCANKDFPNEKLDNSDRHTAQLLILSKKSFRQFCALFQPVLDPYQESQVRKQSNPEVKFLVNREQTEALIHGKLFEKKIN